MVFTVLGALAEPERSLIAERVRAGLRNAPAKGKHFGRPRVIVDRARMGRLRAEGLSWASIAAEHSVGVGEGTVYRMSLPEALSQPDLEMVALDYFRRLGHDNTAVFPNSMHPNSIRVPLRMSGASVGRECRIGSIP
jgi:hypothetical protein